MTRASRDVDSNPMAMACPRPRKRHPAYTIGVFGGPKAGVTSILDMYIFGTIIDHAIEGFGFANPHQIAIDVERVSPYTERTANLIVSRIAQGKLPQELCDLIVEKVINLRRLNTQTCKVELRQLKLRPEYPTLHHYQLRTCDGIMLMYDATSLESFEYIKTLYEDVKKVFRVALDLRPFPFPLVVVANKVDLHAERKISRCEGIAWASSINRAYFETSMRDYASMSKAMHGITKAIYLYEELPLQFWRKPVNAEVRPVQLGTNTLDDHERVLMFPRSQPQKRSWLNCRVLQRIMEGPKPDPYADND